MRETLDDAIVFVTQNAMASIPTPTQSCTQGTVSRDFFATMEIVCSRAESMTKCEVS